MSDLQLELNAAASVLRDMDRELMNAEMRAVAAEEDSECWRRKAEYWHGVAQGRILGILLLVCADILVAAFVIGRSS